MNLPIDRSCFLKLIVSLHRTDLTTWKYDSPMPLSGVSGNVSQSTPVITVYVRNIHEIFIARCPLACSPTASQYVSRHDAKFEMMPPRTRPKTSPKMRPERVIDMDRALILDGARSAVHGIHIWGVTFFPINTVRYRSKEEACSEDTDDEA